MGSIGRKREGELACTSWYARELNPHLLLQEVDNKSSISMPFKNIKRRCQNGGNTIEEDIRILRRGKHQG